MTQALGDSGVIITLCWLDVVFKGIVELIAIEALLYVEVLLLLLMMLPMF